MCYSSALRGSLMVLQDNQVLLSRVHFWPWCSDFCPRCNRQTHSPHVKLYLAYDSAYVNDSQAVPRVGFGIWNSSQPIPWVVSLAVINICQTIPWVQFGYNLHMPKHTLDNVNIGYGLAVMPDTSDFRGTTCS